MKKLVYLLLSSALFVSCLKGPVDQLPAPVPGDDARTILLKEIITEKLPNPYYKFVYDTARYVTQVSFASNLSVYNVAYENKRVKKLTNIKNGHTLLYNYTGGNVARIDEYSLINTKMYSYELLYSAEGKLNQVVWKEFMDDASGIVFKKVEFTYHADGNLASIKNYGISSGELIWTSTRLYSNYDSRSNVDDFYVMMDFFDSFLFLPQVKLQLNNPGKEFIASDVNEFDITNTYQFVNNLPVRKIIDLQQTKGDHAGQKGHFTNQFTYY